MRMPSIHGMRMISEMSVRQNLGRGRMTRLAVMAQTRNRKSVCQAVRWMLLLKLALLLNSELLLRRFGKRMGVVTLSGNTASAVRLVCLFRAGQGYHELAIYEELGY